MSHHNGYCWDTCRELDKLNKYEVRERDRMFRLRVRRMVDAGMLYGEAVWKASGEVGL